LFYMDRAHQWAILQKLAQVHQIWRWQLLSLI
jgi:hypothetical protein